MSVTVTTTIIFENPVTIESINARWESHPADIIAGCTSSTSTSLNADNTEWRFVRVWENYEQHLAYISYCQEQRLAGNFRPIVTSSLESVVHN